MSGKRASKFDPLKFRPKKHAIKVDVKKKHTHTQNKTSLNRDGKGPRADHENLNGGGGREN